MNKIIVLILCIFLNSAVFAANGCMSSEKQNGVNLAGAEFNSGIIPGALWKNYVFPTTKQLEYYRDKGVRSIRLPITWNRMQLDAYDDLNETYLAEVKKVLHFTTINNICLIIDLHNYGRFKGKPLIEHANYDLIFYDFWLKMGEEFKSDFVAFGLMNEPAYISRTEWRDLAQKTVNRLRSQHIANLILVSGGGWSGAHSWFSGLPSNDQLFANFTDPLNNIAIEMHQYADSNYSGTRTDCIEGAKMVRILQSATNWAQVNRKRLWLGEFGFAASAECMNTMREMLIFLDSSKIWMGWSYWAAGAWWGNYPFSVEPNINYEKEQIQFLQKYF